MTYFPIRYKPTFDFSQTPIAFEYPHVITKDMAEDIIDLARNYDGWHRRGSNEKHTTASFTTTLIHDITHPIYDILDNLWKKFTDEHRINLDFVEFYEVKEYLEGDSFDLHIDSHNRISETLDRKMNLIIQLSDSDSYTGGDLSVMKHVVSRDFGTAIFFPAHYLHRISPIISGTRYSLIGHGWGTVDRK